MAADVNQVAQHILSRNENWYFDQCGEIGGETTYELFRDVVAEHVGVQREQVALVGSTIYGFSMSPKGEKTFSAFHDESDLDLVIVSETLFRSVWNELVEAYHRGYRWVMTRHADEIFRKFALLVNDGNYKTNVLRKRVKLLDGISKQVYLRTGSSRPLKYRIYESQEAAVAYHASGLAKIKRKLENDS
ncbi:hypothetical protein [uncultured Tateyamaria sp.]|uniref:hypothetical protein n=1 Tax=uncultured Tateyamaria sp. TaxID=455651 RepID=UPI00261E58DF|nr:hypothetical protein [uncultured Tateyamaria sp.]